MTSHLSPVTAQRRWIRPFARLGYAARGLVYLVIGSFAVASAFGGGRTQDTRDALRFITDSGFGSTVALVLVIGLAGYAVWRAVQSVFDTDDHGVSPKGLGVRAGLLVSAFTYATLTIYTLSLWRGAGGEDEGGGAAAEFLSGIVGARPAAWLLAAVFAIVAGAHIAKALRRGYRKHIRTPPAFDAWLDPVGMAGLIARGLVFAVIAVLFATRGIHASSDGSHTPGLRDALDFLLNLPFGRILLIAMGAGLIVFSLYSFVEALWRRVNVEDASMDLGT